MDNTIGNVKIITRKYLDSDVQDGAIDYQSVREESWPAETVGEAVKILRSEGLTEFCEDDFRMSGWFMDPNTSYVSDYGTGENTEITGHLEGFSPEAAQNIYYMIVNDLEVPDDDDDDDDMTWDEAYEKYDDMINETSTVKIGDVEYDAARVLREVDPIAYRTGFADWTDAEDIDTDNLTGTDPYP